MRTSTDWAYFHTSGCLFRLRPATKSSRKNQFSGRYRQMLTLHATAYEFGPYRLDPLGRSLLRDGEVVALPPKAVEVLMALIRNPGTVVGKPELIDAVWPESFVEEANLNQMIFLLRRAFGDNGGGDYIATIP